MEDRDIQNAMADIEGTQDLLERALKLAGLVSSLFAQAGYPLLVVGGSAVEFYTEGAYMSGDIDFCRLTRAVMPLRLQADIMARLGATGGPRNWKAGGLFVDLLGLVENESRSPLREVQTPYGTVRFLPPELLLVERVFEVADSQGESAAGDAARKILLEGLRGDMPLDWDEALRLAALPSFRVLDEVKALRKEVEDALEG
jgi:hypothetical protein